MPVERDTDVLSVKETAALLRESVYTTYRRLNSGQLEGVQYIKGGRWWITRGSVHDFLDPARRRH